MIDLALWIFAIAATSMLAASLASALGLRALGPLLDRVEPRARGRIWAFVAFLPFVVAVLVTGAVLLPHPWLGLPEHCFGHDDDHLHLCLAHGAPTPSLAVIALAGVFGVRALVGLALELARAVRAMVALRRLRAVGAEVVEEVTQLPIDAPLAFTAGWLRPQVFASRPIADGWPAVIAHELDHARHRDPLVRLLVRLAVTLHAPGVATWIVRALESAQELAADEHAARTVGDRLEVAEQILAFAREAARSPAAAVAFAEGDVAGRVGALLDTPRYVRGPSLAHGALIVAVGGVLVALASTSIHHAIEDLLAVFGA